MTAAFEGPDQETGPMTADDRIALADRPLDDASKLNIERAREALARGRPDAAAAALRSPRPADLSRLRDGMAEKHKIEARANAFRAGLRAKLGLGEFAGPYSPVAFPTGDLLTGQAICDADICAPAAPPVPEFRRLEAGDPPPPPRPAAQAADVDLVEAITGHQPAPRQLGAEPAGEALDELETVESWLSGEPDPASRKAEAKKPKRRKLFGLF